MTSEARLRDDNLEHHGAAEMRQPPKVFIVVLNYKGWRDTIACLESVYSGTYTKFEAVVVDNGSGDESLGEIKSWAALRAIDIKAEIDLHDRTAGGIAASSFETRFEARAVTLIETGVNLGFSAGNNRGIEYALANGADFIFLLNNDTVVQGTTLERLVLAAQSDAQIGAVFPLILSTRGEIQVPVYVRGPENFWELLLASNLVGYFWPRYQNIAYLERRNPFPDYRYDRLIIVPSIVVACTLYRRAFFERVGLFDENVFMYNEEYILLHRLQRTNLLVALEPRARLVHKGGVDNSRLPPALRHTKSVCGEMYYARTYMRVALPGRILLKILRLLEYTFKMARSADYRLTFPEFLREYMAR